MTTNADQISWEADESLRDLAARLTAKPTDIRVVSFDFFDTLICRMCADSNELFIEVGRRLAQGGHLLMPLSPAEFRATRMAADERARKKAVAAGTLGEVKLSDIYAELTEVVRNPAAAREVEFEIERTFCYVNPATASFVQHVRALGYRTAVLSDTYFTAAELQRLLRENGLAPALFDTFIVSCERGAAKWNGTLYQELFRHFGVHPNEVLHLGDNLHADVGVARQYRAEAVHYYKTTPNLDVIFKGERTLRGTGAPPAASLDSLRALTARRAESNRDAFRDGALTFGPVLARYADWCVERFAAAGVTTVLALMREGEVLGELLQRAALAAGVPLNVRPCYASRLSTAHIAMTELTPEKAMELLEGSVMLTPQTVFDILGIGAEAERFLEKAALDKPFPSNEGLNGLIKLLFNQPATRQLLETRRARDFELGFEYLSSLAGNEAAIGMVDLGWSGSIQRNITRILRRGGRKVRSVGCYVACTRRAGRLALEGSVAHGFLEYDWARSTILPEIAITAMVGSTNGYARDAAGKVAPVLGDFQLTAAERQAKTRLREGIFAFQSAWLDLRKAKGPGAFTPEMLADLDTNSAAIFYRLLEYPTKPEADRLGILCHDENYFGVRFNAPLCDDDLSPKQLRREGIMGLFSNAKCYWPQGVAARCNPRLVSALRSGWSDPAGLGQLGAWGGLSDSDAGVTQAELTSLTRLVRGLSADQIVFAGPFARVLEEAFSSPTGPASDLSTGVAGHKRLIVCGPATEAVPSPEFSKHCAVVPGDPADLRVLRAVRAHLAPGGNVALVLSGNTTPAGAQALLNGLAPFLGAQGMVLAACGRFDRNSLGDELPVVESLNRWAKSNGTELGFGLWGGATGAAALLCDWIVFIRKPETTVWSRQWMLNIGDQVGELTTQA